MLVATGTFLPWMPTSKVVSPPELEANDFALRFFFLSLPLLGIAPGAPLYNALTGPDWPVREGSSFMKHGIPCCWLVVELGTPREQRPGRTVERSKGESERTKRKGRNLHLVSFVSNPSINFTS